MIGGYTMDETGLQLTLSFLLENISTHDLLEIAKKEKIGGVPRKINKTYKVFVIKNLLNKKNMSKTIQILKKAKLTSTNDDNNDSAKAIFEAIFSNFVNDNIEENAILIGKYNKIKKVDNKNKKVIDKKNNSDTNLANNSNIQTLQKKIVSRDIEIKELKEKNSKLNKHISEISNQLIGYEKNEVNLNNQIRDLKDSNRQLAALKDANSKFYKKKINKAEIEIRQLQLKIDSINEGENFKQVSSDESDNMTDTIGKKEENRLLIQAPEDSILRRELRKSDIEIIESRIFSIPNDDFGKVYNSVEEIPNIIKYDISKYNYVYLYKDKLPVGDRSKLKSMFSKSVIREITDVKEILK